MKKVTPANAHALSHSHIHGSHSERHLLTGLTCPNALASLTSRCLELFTCIIVISKEKVLSAYVAAMWTPAIGNLEHPPPALLHFQT